MRKLIYFGATAALAMSASIAGAVTSDVNSGNPKFPFPQFMDYGENRKSLASHNAPGVTHAEMEKRIRDAWQHICNDTKKHGYEVDGVQYLIPDTDESEDRCSCAEGDGYYLLGAALMADKTYFDGYYMDMHDRTFVGTKRFIDGGENSYDNYSRGLNHAGSKTANASWEFNDIGASEGSATDGDVDIALSLLIAYSQWGEHSGIMTRFGELNYKEEALKYIRAMVDTVLYPLNNEKYVSGVVGFDGYLKGGSHQTQLTPWGGDGSGINYRGIPGQYGGTQFLYFDYLAPAYFNEYRKLLESDSKSTDWQINQCLRCEASSDYLMGKLFERSETSIPVCGSVEMGDNEQEFIFGNQEFSEDFRAGWRTILNYVWHGDPEYSWDPVTHEAIPGSNDYEKRMGERYGKFLANPQAEPWNNPCNALGDMANKGLSFTGPYTLRSEMDIDGKMSGKGFPLNWIHGGGSPAAIVSQDFELMGQMFRHCIIAWDDENFKSYEESSPHYFHEWFKMLGMLVLSGNFHAPSNMVAKPNLKVYHKVNKTYAFAGDTVKFTISTRNYGSVDAKNTFVKFGLPNGFVLINTDKGNATTLVGDSIVWNIGVLPGFQSDKGIAPTTDSLIVTCKLSDNIKQDRYCTSARIYCSNGIGWTSDEYPNNITSVMERNCVDVVARALKIEKSCNREKINPDNLAQFTIDFENSSEAGWINGGRPGVRLTYAYNPIDNPSNTQSIVSHYRLFHDADEAYIDYGNYRVSYYMYDPNLTCFKKSDPNCPAGWNMFSDFYQGGDVNRLDIKHEMTVEGEDPDRPGKKYNQRIIVQFANQLATITQHLQQYAGESANGDGDGLHVHEGGGKTLFIETRMACSIDGKSFDLTDDWSFDEDWASEDSKGLFYPITKDHTNPNNELGEDITKWDRHACGESNKTVDRILVEEWDGYTWRRVLGNGPMPGRDVYNVVIRDTLPVGMEFVEFVGACPLEEFGGSWKTLKTSDGRDVIEWTIDRMMIQQGGKIIYNANVTFPTPGTICPTEDETIINKAWIWGDKESAIWDTTSIIVTCAEVPEPIIKTTMTKVSDKEAYEVGDDITYTIGYKQTHGAIFDNAETLASDWDLSQWSVTGGALTSSPNVSGTASFGKSKGNNNYVAMDVSTTSYAAFRLIFREGAASPITVEIKPEIQIENNSQVLKVKVYDGGVIKETEKEVIIVGEADPFHLVVDLTGDKLRLWVNKDTSLGPALFVKGLSLGTGNFALKNGDNANAQNHGSHKFSNIHVHTDFAYDISITDRVPKGIKVDEGSFESYHNGISAGTGKYYTGVERDSIVWTGLANNPIAFGDTFTVIWKGNVEACNGSIINLAYTKLLGHSDNEIRAQIENKCIDEDCEGVTEASLTINNKEAEEICEGDSAILKAVALPKSNKYEYEFFIGNTSLGEASSVDTFVVKEPGNYKVKVSDPTCPSTIAKSSKNTVKLTVNALPDETIKDEAKICEGEPLDLSKYTVDDHTIEWFTDIDQTDPIEAKEIPADDVLSTYYYVLTAEDGTKCRGESTPFSVVINDLPSAPIVEEKKELPLKEAGVMKDISDMAQPSKTGNSLVWYESDGTTEIEAPIRVDLGVEGPQTFYVREKSKDGGCLGEAKAVEIVVTSSQTPEPENATICVGEEIELKDLVTAEEGCELIWYDKEGNEITPKPETYSSNEIGDSTFTVAQKKGETISEKTTFTITTVDVAKLKEDVEKFYCAGEEASDLKAEIDITACPTCKTPTSYNWYQGEDDVKITNLTPKTNVQELSIYYYKVEPVYKISENHSCVGSKVDYTVTVTFVPTAKPARPIMYTLSDAVGGVFPSLTDKDPGAIAPSDARSTLEWYTADGELIGEDGTVPPSPTMDMVDPASEVTTITYKVKQVKNGCKSAFEDVTVIITKTPTPKPEDANFCEGETPDAIENYVTFDPGYDPVWYDGDPLNGGMEVSTALTINTAADPGKAETVRKYFVAQRNSDGTSAAIPIKVTVYTKPKIKTYDKKSCGEPVSTLDLWDPVSRDVEDTHFYVGNTELPNKNTSITSTSSVTIIGYFYYKNKNELKECQSELSKVYIEIHDLGTVKIEPEGDYAICPNSAAELNVSITGANLEDSTLTYSWNKNNNAIEDGKFLSDPITEATTFSVTISDGVCTKTFEKKVGINPGKIDGHVEFTEANSDRPVTKELASSEGVKYYSCDEDVEISVDNVQGSDFVWDDRISGSSITKKGGIYNLTYKDANNCKTGFKIEIIPTPIIDYTVPFDSTLCEGENVTLTANLISGTEAADIVWIKDDTDEISTDASLVLKKVTSENSGKYTYKAISKDKRCKSFGSFGTLNVLPRPTYKIKEVEPICAGNSQQIGLETLTPSTAKVEWAPNPTLTPGTITADVTPEDNETYSFTISQDGGCKITEDITVTVVQPIDFKINANDTILCENNIGNLKFGLKIAEGDVLSYEWKNDKDSVVSSSSVMRFNEKTIGTYNYKVTLTSEACPPAFDNIQVTIASVPIIDTVNLIDYHNVEIVPNTTYGEAPYEYKVDANEFSSEENVKVSYGHHTAVIRDNNGCMNTYEFDTEAPSFEIPIVVTPNNDGVNDKFISQVIAEAYPDAVVTIYDRFGKKLTEIKGNESWDGTYQGHKMPTTDYWYEIWIEEIRKKYVGHFTLIND